MTLVVNWAGGAFVPFGLTATAQPAQASLVMAGMEPCHEHPTHNSPTPDTPSPHQRHACCPAVGLTHTLPPLQLIPSSAGALPAPTVHAYADVIFSIDKPPKARV